MTQAITVDLPVCVPIIETIDFFLSFLNGTPKKKKKRHTIDFLAAYINAIWFNSQQPWEETQESDKLEKEKCYGLDCVPLQLKCWSLDSPISSECGLSGNPAFKEVIHLKWDH